MDRLRKIKKENKIKDQIDKKIEYAQKHKEQIKLETKNMSQEEKNNYKKFVHVYGIKGPFSVKMT